MPLLCLAPAHSVALGALECVKRAVPALGLPNTSACFCCCYQFSLELWQEMLTEFITQKSRDASEQWVIMGNSIGGLLTLMLTESLQGDRKVGAR